MTHRTILRLKDVIARCGLSRSSIYTRIAQGAFPKPLSLGPRAVGWTDRDVEAWIRQQEEKGRAEWEALRTEKRSHALRAMEGRQKKRDAKARRAA